MNRTKRATLIGSLPAIVKLGRHYGRRSVWIVRHLLGTRWDDSPKSRGRRLDWSRPQRSPPTASTNDYPFDAHRIQDPSLIDGRPASSTKTPKAEPMSRIRLTCCVSSAAPISLNPQIPARILNSRQGRYSGNLILAVPGHITTHRCSWNAVEKLWSIPTTAPLHQKFSSGYRAFATMSLVLPVNKDLIQAGLSGWRERF